MGLQVIDLEAEQYAGSEASTSLTIEMQRMETPRSQGGIGGGTRIDDAPVVACTQHLLQPNGSVSGRDVARALLPRFPDLLSAVPVSYRRALASVDGRSPVTHVQIRDFLRDTAMVLQRRIGVAPGRHRVAVVLPNGPELALAILAVTHSASCVPLNAFAPIQELRSDIRQSACDLIIGLDEGSSADVRGLAAALQLPFCGLIPDQHYAGLFQLVPPAVGVLASTPSLRRRRSPTTTTTSEADRSAGNTVRASGTNGSDDDDESPPAVVPSQHDDEILVLFTSGTTGSKKLVPHCLADVLVATACISVSWKLSPIDTNCNLMPLFHVGGIIRQVFSPVLSGGCVICCPSFDPALFWTLLHHQAFTWYYAAPTMHHVILQTGKAEGYLPDRGVSDNKSVASTSSTAPKLRMIANAAGGLLPSLARELRQAFSCNVLPSYGMTECMPISSPPANYQLEKPGTSGVAVGPELAILNTTTMQPVTPGKEGPICVRSEPCFRGYGVLYGTAAEEKPSTFLPGGWFNTGDLGYMDEAGYLYITGRSKEVINRGGEIISPMEVEEAIVSHPDVQACVAFSTQHAVLQEVVGLLLVPVKGRPRLDLPALHEYLGTGQRLAAPKWPQCVVYMDAVPKSYTNKLLRVKLGKRLSLPELNDSMYWIERTFEATCPPQGAPVSVAIPCQRVSVRADHVQVVLRTKLITRPDQDIVVVPHPAKLGSLVAHVHLVDRLAVVRTAQEHLHAYEVPHYICFAPGPLPSLQYDPDYYSAPPESSDAIGSIVQEAASRGRGPADPLVMELQELFQALLDLDCLPAPETNFFNIGGSSMLASQLASKIRKGHSVPFGGAEVFHASSCNAIAALIRERRGEPGSEARDGSVTNTSSMAASSLFSLKLDLSKTPFDPTRIEIQPSYLGLLFQMIPLCIIYPLWLMTRFFLFFRCLLWILNTVPGERNLYKFVLTLVVFHASWVTFTPLLFVLIKWVVIGRYRKGRYPIWGEYYLRWWFVDVLRKLIGRGSWGAHHVTLNLYYRMLGAKIGKNARISETADVAEFDLVSIGEGASVEHATVRGFGVDNGCIILGPVEVGDHASVGIRSVVAPYTSIPDNTHLGPSTASYEINAMTEPGRNVEHLHYNRQALPECSRLAQTFMVGPCLFLCDSLSHIPALLVLFWMLEMRWNVAEPFNTTGDLMEWLCDPRRIPFFIGIRIARAILSPVFYMFGAILIKWIVIGKFEPGPRDTTSDWQLCRHELAACLFTRERMQQLTDLIGRHYEGISVLYRLLGAKVGKRVFWPGRQPVFTDSAEKITLCAGSNVSDNTVVLPGSVIGKGAVLGSNAVCAEGQYLPEASVWLGARGGQPVLLEKGVEEDIDRPILASEVHPSKLQMEGDDSTLRPFGRAFYNREAPYFVFPLSLIFLYTIVVRVLLAAFSSLPVIAAMHLAAGYFYGWPMYERSYALVQVSSSSLYTTLVFFFMVTHFLHTMAWLTVEIASKWGFMGQRQEGRHNWDRSNYSQNWEFYQLLSPVRDLGRMNFLDFICGTPFMSTFFRLLGCKVGNDCCLYPAGGDPYMPEPDLVEMGNRCVIDCASVVCHLNTRGNFELKKITMQNNVTLRCRGRIQQGVHMESGSMLLEKSLAMTGEVIESDSVWLGAPAARLLSYDTSSIDTRPSTRSNFPDSPPRGGAFV